MSRNEAPTAADYSWFAEQYGKLVDNVEQFIRGKRDVVRKAALCLIAEGHLLIEDVPGTGKTTLAKALIASIDGTMRRFQFAADSMPSDLIGVPIYNPASSEFEFHPGPVFCNILLADEINRASPRTQSALLEVMAEQQCTVDGLAYLVPRPFVVIATQNPVDHEGTYRLPEAQLDRFLMKLSVGYPDETAEVEILGNRSLGKSPEDLRPVMTVAEMQRMTAIAGGVHVAESLRRYIVQIVNQTRPPRMKDVRLGVSTRGAEALMIAAKTLAASEGSNFVSDEHISALAADVLQHRMLMAPGSEHRDARSLISARLDALPLPHYADVSR